LTREKKSTWIESNGQGDKEISKIFNFLSLRGHFSFISQSIVNLLFNFLFPFQQLELITSLSHNYFLPAGCAHEAADHGSLHHAALVDVKTQFSQVGGMHITNLS